MLNLVERLVHTQAYDAAAMREMLQATARNLVVLSGIFWLIVAIIVTAEWGGHRIAGLLICMALVAVIYLAAFRLIARHYRLGIAVWLAGTFAAVFLSSWLLENPALLLLGVVLPLVAVITLGRWAGIAAEATLALLVWAMVQSSWDAALSREQAWLIILTGAFCGLLGWAARSELVALAEWSLSSFDDARRHLNAAREQRLELEQSREDLLLANRELMRLSERLKAMERIAEEARQAKTEFVANVSHELRTPLNMIIGFADIISRSPHVYGGRLPPSLMTDIGAIKRNADHLSALVNDVLDLSQVEAGRMALSRDWVELEPLIAGALSVVDGLYASRGLYVHAEVEPGLPPVFCDETRVRQIIINLLGNAGRFTEQGGVTLQCSVSGPELVVSVADTGPGIAVKDQKRIFEPFQQADVSTRRRQGGSGLGLTISKQFVEMHGGRLWLESQPGAGTTISFSLPIEAPSPLEGMHISSVRRALVVDDEIGYHLRTHPSRAPLPAVSERLVVVDPERTVQRMLGRYLPGVEVEVAADLDSGIAALRRSPAQALIVNDSPFDAPASAALGALPFGTPAIYCWLPGEHEAARRLGVVEYLVKPLSQDKLVATLARLEPRIRSVLIVDDEEDELQLFARMLESESPRLAILQVTNGPRALSMLRSRRPDVMLLDLNMPGMTGFQVLEEKMRDPSIAEIPVVVISSRDPAGDPVFSNALSVVQGTGFSQRKLIDCIQALGAILAPPLPEKQAEPPPA